MKKGMNIITTFFTISIAFLICNMVAHAESESNVAQINDTFYNSLKEAVAAAKEGDTITLLKDTTENSTMNINVGMTINGNGHNIEYTGTGTSAAFDIRTSSETTISNMNVESSGRGIIVTSSTHNVTLKKIVLTVADRGVNISSDENKNATLNINDCMIQRAGFNNYEEYVPNDGGRGISLWQYQNSNITIKNTTIQGFAYVINTASQVSFQGTKLSIDNSTLRGRAGLNIWDSDLEIDIRNSEILGINNEKGTSESFGNIVLNGSARNTKLNIANTKFLNYENETGQNNPNALQYMLKIRSINNTISISGNTSFLDSTKKLDDNISYGIDKYTNIDNAEQLISDNNIQITGGNYSYDMTDYITKDYESKKVGETYQVIKKEDNNITIDVKELDTNTKVDKVVLGTTNITTVKQILLDTLTTTKEVDIENKNVKVDITMNDIELSDKEKEEFNKNKKIPEATFVNYFDIEVQVIDTDTNNKIGNLTTLNNKITFTILLPSELQTVKSGYQRKYYVLREHNGNYDLLDTALEDNKASLTFETDKFSNYALIYVDEKIIENPNTYDGIISYLTIGGISFIGLICLGTYLKTKH